MRKLFATFALLYQQTPMEEHRISISLMDEAKTFILSLPEKTQKKIAYNINRVRGGEIDKELFEKLNDQIWELRTIFNGFKYRLLCFWDPSQRALIIATHGFVKKTQKTPLKEIAKAEAIRKDYMKNK